MDLKEKIKEYIMEKNHVSFVEIEEIFDKENYDYRGNYARGLSRDYKTIFIWFNWSKEAIDLLDSIVDMQHFEYEPCSHVIYLIDGKIPNIPIARKLIQYKTDHWLPVVIINKRGKSNE